MPAPGKKLLSLAAIGIGGLLALRFLLPVGLPFLFGGLAALVAEPLVKRLARRIPRSAAAGIGVTLTLVLASCLLLLVLAAAVRELGRLAQALPDLGQTAMQGITALQEYLTGLAQSAPPNLQPTLLSIVERLFSGSQGVIDSITRQLPGLAGTVLSAIPGSFLSLGTGIFSAYMFSARLPRIRTWLKSRLGTRLQTLSGALGKLRRTMAGWLKAQLKLSGVCFLLIGTGLLLLRIPNAIVWALLIALVDAVPILGTGTVLLPWALVSLIQGLQPRALGLLGLYVTTLLCRSALEPRLVGKQLGLDPLVTLLCMYAGYRFFGFWGILLSPLLSVGLTEAAALFKPAKEA